MKFLLGFEIGIIALLDFFVGFMEKFRHGNLLLLTLKVLVDSLWSTRNDFLTIVFRRGLVFSESLRIISIALIKGLAKIGRRNSIFLFFFEIFKIFYQVSKGLNKRTNNTI